MRKKILMILLLLLAAAVHTGWAQNSASDAVAFGDWRLVRIENGWSVAGYAGEESDRVIPDSFEDIPVIRLDNNLFSNDRLLESIFIPDSVTVIGANAFYGCTSLREVHLPNNLRRIETNTFRYCTALEEIDIPFTVNFIGPFAFADCIQLKEIILLSVTTIGESAFDGCTSLASVRSSRKTTQVDAYAFRDTSWLESNTDEFVFIGNDILIKWNGNSSDVTVPYGTTALAEVFEDNQMIETVSLPDTVTRIGKNAFANAVNLRHVDMPPYISVIGANAFDGCFSLEEISIPDAVISIGGTAFRSCAALKEVVIPSGVTVIPGNLFANCANLTSVSIPAEVTKIDVNTFLNAPNVRLLTVFDSYAEQFAQENGIPYTTVAEREGDFIFSRDADGIIILRYTGKLADVEIPSSIQSVRVTGIGNGAFQNNSYIQRVIMPTSVKSVGDWAFSYMSSLEYMQIPTGLKKLGSNVFTGSENLQEIKLPRRLQSIGDEPFDIEAVTRICASENSEASRILQEMGYEIFPNDSCSDYGDILAAWGEKNKSADVRAVCICPDPEAEPEPEPDVITRSDNNGIESAGLTIQMIRIPDSASELTADMLPGGSSSLILVIPSSVTVIDEQILDGRDMVIVGDIGSSAEKFAAEHEVKFMSSLNISINN